MNFEALKLEKFCLLLMLATTVLVASCGKQSNETTKQESKPKTDTVKKQSSANPLVDAGKDHVPVPDERPAEMRTGGADQNCDADVGIPLDLGVHVLLRKPENLIGIVPEPSVPCHFDSAFLNHIGNNLS